MRARWNEVLGEAFVHIASIRHLDDIYNEFFILDFVENPELPLANPIARILPRELLATTRSRIGGEFLNPCHDELTCLLSIDRFNFFGRGALDDQLIFCHCASYS